MRRNRLPTCPRWHRTSERSTHAYLHPLHSLTYTLLTSAPTATSGTYNSPDTAVFPTPHKNIPPLHRPSARRLLKVRRCILHLPPTPFRTERALDSRWLREHFAAARTSAARGRRRGRGMLRNTGNGLPLDIRGTLTVIPPSVVPDWMEPGGPRTKNNRSKRLAKETPIPI